MAAGCVRCDTRLHGTVMDMDALPGMLRRVNVTDDTRPYTAPYNSRHLEQPGSTGYQRLYWPGRAKNTVEFFSPAEGAFGCREPTCTWRFETAAEMKAHFRRHHKADWDADARAKVALDRINAAKNLDKDKFAAVVLEVVAALDTMAKERVIAAQGGDVSTALAMSKRVRNNDDAREQQFQAAQDLQRRRRALW